MADEEVMAELMTRRRVLKSKLTRLENNVNTLDAAADPVAAGVQLDLLQRVENEICTFEDDVLAAVADGDDDEDNEQYRTHETACNELMRRCTEVRINLTRMIQPEPTRNEQASAGAAVAGVRGHHGVKLPRLETPKFSGNLHEWISFRDRFGAAIHNQPANVLRGSQKLEYLKASLTDEAAEVIQSIQITDDNYQVAWDLLVKQYENKREIARTHLERLFEQESVMPDGGLSLRGLVNRTNECMRSLKILGAPVETWDVMVCFVVCKKLDAESRQQWELTFHDGSFPKLDEFLEFLDRRARALAASGPPVKTQQQVQRKKPQTQGVKSCNLSTTAASHCGICKADHSVYSCAKLLEAGHAEKQDMVQTSGLCFNCLQPGHLAKKCNGGSCRKCKRRHNTLLHVDKPEEKVEETPDDNEVASHLSCKLESNQVLLATARVQAEDKFGQVMSLRSLIDGGSQATFITETCVQRLGLKRSSGNLGLSGLGKTKLGRTKGKVDLLLRSDFDPKFSLTVQAYVLPETTNWQPQVPVSKNWAHLKDLKLADPSYHLPGEIDLLLGADAKVDILQEGLVKGPKGTPVGQLTVFGWIVWGPISSVRDTVPVAVHHAQLNLESIVKRFWEVEEVPAKAVLTAEEKLCEEHYVATSTRDGTGRYVVRLPFKSNAKPLGNSRDIALKRLFQTGRKLGWDTEKRKKYAAVLDEYLTLGHMEPVPATELAKPTDKLFYHPHHAVIKESSTTTKVRVVFDGSAKTTSGASLNGNLMVGATIQQDLFHILVRARRHKIMFCADIEKMYRQVWVHPDDRDFQRILWRSSPQEPIQEFRLKTVTFGTASAPFQAIRTLHKLAEDEAEHFPLACSVIKTDFYVDDCISGADSLDTAVQLQDQLLEVLKRGGLPLRKWSSNCEALLERLPDDMRETKLPLKIDADETVKTLGIQWNPSSDTFGFTVTAPPNRDVTTKRTILSDMSRVFDPLGWLGPVTVQSKVLFQSMWKLQLEWDEPVPNEVAEEWINYRDDLSNLRDVKLPRCMCINDAVKHELHCFSDASETAYAGVVFLRSMNADGESWTRVVAAKTKVAPIKTTSLPRLELCGALLLSRLTETILESLQMKMDAVYAYTDSTIVLAWVTSPPHRWKRYVANRVAEIQEVLAPSVWRHVGTKDNPADCASRGISVEELKTHNLWWNGPKWVQAGTYPLNPNIPHHAGEVPEEKVEKILVHLVTSNYFMDHFSSFMKMIKCAAYCHRFSSNCRAGKGNHVTEPLTSDDFRKAEDNFVKVAQADAFSEELKTLRYNKTKKDEDPVRPLPTKSKLANLVPFLDDNGIVRVGGRLKHSKLAYEMKHPAILPSHHHFTDLLLQFEHLRSGHGGPQLMLSTLLERYWIMGARDAVRRVVRKCLKCHRFNAVIAEQMMADLPSNRVNAERPFLNVGLDYAGPISLRVMKSKRGRKQDYQTYKGYVALFICFSTRAIHLEVVSDLSSGAGLAAVDTFVSLRGLPESITSDRATNFQGVANELRSLISMVNSPEHNYDMTKFCAERHIKWKMNPPAAPHFGGYWEAGIKSFKYHFRRVVGTTPLTFEEAHRVVAKISACLNSRPLTALSSDPNDLNVLTPGHFITGDSLLALPQQNLTKKAVNLLTRWQLVQRLTQHFWQRWSKEYLTRLQQRPKWWKYVKNITEGELVLIRDDNQPPLKWKLGRVMKVHPGQDHKVRAVTLKTADGEIVRPIVKVSLLPFNNDDVQL